MKRKIGFISTFIFVLSFLFVFSFGFSPVHADVNKVYLGGLPAGFSLQTRGANVVGLCDVITNDGIESPAKDADIKIGDIILNIDDIEINNAQDIERSICGKNKITIIIDRKSEKIEKIVIPAKDLSGNYKMGIFVREDVSGIGTITFIKGDRFASLGHPVVGDDGKILRILGGEIFDCNITGCVKGERGKAGELRGVFLKNNPVAKIDKNTECGVYGCLTKEFDRKNLLEIETGCARIGDAKIYTTIDDNTPSYFNISIVKIDDYGSNKNFVIKINDKSLLEITGGIVQGMSGSPIIQNGKLVGAVTHVFINDPTRGFGISIDNMINN